MSDIGEIIRVVLATGEAERLDFSHHIWEDGDMDILAMALQRRAFKHLAFSNCAS